MVQTNNSNIPLAPLLLGFAGLIPFMLPPIWVLIIGPSGILALKAVILQQTYAAIILSFLGAVHWGLEIASDRTVTDQPTKPDYNVLMTSVSPALFAWFCLQMNSSTYSLLALAAGFTLLLSYDISRKNQARYMPLWYPKLRTWLTIFAVTSLVLMAFL